MPDAYMQVRVLDDVVDELGNGRAQLLFLFLGGGIGLLAGAVKCLLSVSAKLLGDEWHLDGYHTGALVSVVFIGQGLGNVIFGILSDKIGRRPVLQAYYVFVAFFAFATSLATDFWSMLALRAALGLCFGLGTTPANALMGEVATTYSRVPMNALCSVLFVLGIMYGLVLVWFMDPSLEKLDWRVLSKLAVLPGLLLFLAAWMWLLESPRFLDGAARRDDAVTVLKRMRSLNGRPEVDVEQWMTAEATDYRGGISTVFRGPLGYTTLTICLSCFVLNYAYYGALYAYPQLLPAKQMFLSPAGNMILGLCVEIVGYGLAVDLERRGISRRVGLLTYLLGLAICSVAFYISYVFAPRTGEAVETRHRMPMVLACVAMYGSSICLSIGWIFVYVYAAEVYPTAYRAAGSGVGIAFGRLGSTLCPISFEVLTDTLGFQAHFGVVVGLTVVNALLVATLPLETKDRQLGEIAAELRPTLCKRKGDIGTGDTS